MASPWAGAELPEKVGRLSTWRWRALILSSSMDSVLALRASHRALTHSAVTRQLPAIKTQIKTRASTRLPVPAGRLGFSFLGGRWVWG